MEHEKNLELGSELLTLRNQKDSFGKMNASLNAKCETQAIKIKEFEFQIGKREEEVARLGDELEKVRAAAVCDAHPKNCSLT